MQFVFRSGSPVRWRRWGFFMIGAIALQVLTGFLRNMALEAKHSNFSLLHRVRIFVITLRRCSPSSMFSFVDVPLCPCSSSSMLPFVDVTLYQGFPCSMLPLVNVPLRRCSPSSIFPYVDVTLCRCSSSSMLPFVKVPLVRLLFATKIRA